MHVQAAIFDDTPLYTQIRDFIVARMHQGEWQPGDRIPAEMALAEEYDVSSGTVRKAIDSLVEKRILIRRQGKGTYVASHNSHHKLFHFFNIVPNHGKRIIPTTDHFSVKQYPANHIETSTLQLSALHQQTDVIRIERLRYIGEEPVIYEIASICAQRFEKVLEMGIDALMNNLYEFYEQHFGIIVLRADDQVSATSADATQAKHLGVASGAPLLCIKRLAVDLEENPVEYRESFCLTDNYYYRGTVL